MINLARKRRIRAKISGDETTPRVVVFRSNKFLYIQAIDDTKGQTLAAGNSSDNDFVKNFVKNLNEKKIKKVVFDRAGYKYHGKVKAVAEDLRKNGLEF
ncbi:MAG: 50S ribosomal protein L18 [Patescibacteria group bacterium]